ncbi:hypothetical protein WH52_03035 [Tenacibaculum holothuriorum]|uniref:Uncharacterized protein n=1 Tax=Tenacibaculum holothuriorum TaxID=1635173 RepID=A0A1Y2PFT3_9FLAO|nr:hypothetical protein [Tenacibaculum holothuriorum]OSY88667.1 hypothetical protein WH52_03035 [Tenacibaculum holothuriorum]
MSITKTINGVTITVNFCNKINATAIPESEISKGAPLANIYKTSPTADTYTVNIVSYVPTTLNIDNPPNPDEVISLDNNAGYLYLAYKGLQDVNTPINQGKVNCRTFWFEFDANDGATQFDLYQTQFVYSVGSEAGNAEAILVQERNDDPDTDRGTVTTVRNT